MKRAFLLVLGAVILLITFQNTNTEVTPNHTTSTGMVETQGEIIRALNRFGSMEFKRRGASQTPTPSPNPTPLGIGSSDEEIKVNTNPIISSGQTVENTWITFYDCTTEGFCPIEEGGNHTASGTPLEKGKLYAACDTNYWPFGTRIKILEDPTGYVWTCVDTGNLIIGPAHWDVWFYDNDGGKKYLAQLGSDTVTIQIVT